jgi:hypothetical protein
MITDGGDQTWPYCPLMSTTCWSSVIQAIDHDYPTHHLGNDVAEILFGFFISWERLDSLFRVFNEPKRDAFSKVWNTVKPTLPRLQSFAELLRKSKEDTQGLMTLQTSELTPTDVLDDVEPIVLDPDTDEDEAFYPLSDSLRRNSWRLSIPCPGNVWRINYRRDRS